MQAQGGGSLYSDGRSNPIVGAAGFRLATSAGQGKMRLHVPSTATTTLQVPQDVTENLGALGLHVGIPIGAGLKSGAEIRHELDGFVPVDDGSTYLLFSNQLPVGTAGGVKGKLLQAVSLAVVVQPGSDFLFARASWAGPSPGTLAFGLSLTDQLVFHSSAQSKHYTGQVRGNLFVQATDLSMSVKGITGGGYALVDFETDRGDAFSQDRVRDLVAGLFNGDVSGAAGIVGNEIESLIVGTSVDRVAIGGTVRLGTKYRKLAAFSYEAAAASMIVDTDAKEVYARLEVKNAPNPLRDTPLGQPDFPPGQPTDAR